jgi:hypothetical protein
MIITLYNMIFTGGGGGGGRDGGGRGGGGRGGDSGGRGIFIIHKIYK